LNLPKSGDKLVAALVDLRAQAGAGSPVQMPHPIAFFTLKKTVAFIFEYQLSLAAVASLACQLQQLRPAFLDLFGSALDCSGDRLVAFLIPLHF
jgi:hypothetical protein